MRRKARERRTSIAAGALNDVELSRIAIFNPIKCRLDRSLVDSIGHAHMMLACRSKGAPRHERHVRFVEELDREVIRTLMLNKDPWKHVAGTLWPNIGKDVANSAQTIADQSTSLRKAGFEAHQMSGLRGEGRNTCDL